MNCPSEDLRHFLEGLDDSSGTLNLTYGVDLFIGKEPATPINCVTIFDTPGFAPALGLITQGYEYPSVQIRVRNKKYITGWNIIEEIKNSLHGLSQETINGTLYSVVYCSSGPALLDWDDNGNARIVCNFNLQRRAL